MTLSRQNILGQLLIPRLDEPRWSASLERLLRAYQPGGVLLSRHCLLTPSQTAELLHKIWYVLTLPPFLCLQEEGGAVDPLSAFFPSLPPPRAAARRGLSAVKQLGGLIGAGLKLLGFNTCFAPVLDLSDPLATPSLDPQTFSPDPQQVAECGKAFLDGLHQHKVVPCGKHFPGLGSVAAQTRSELPIIGKSMAQLWREDLVPYRELLSDLPIIMLSPAAYKAFDFDLPRSAALSSSLVEGLLRVKLGYRGVTLSCELESEAVRGNLDLGEAAVQAVNAGCDMVLVGRAKSSEIIPQALKRGLECGQLSSQRLEQARERIQRAKRGLIAPSGKIRTRALHQLTRRFEDFTTGFQAEEMKIA